MQKIMLFTVLLFLFACQSSEVKDLGDIDKAEEKLYGDNEDFKFDEALARQTIEKYENFTQKYPTNPKTPDILFKEADLKRALKEYDEALAIYKRVEKDYPQYDKAPHSIFLQGFVYENELNDLDKAKERYEAFLKKYPDHELADDVAFSLKNLGKSPEEIIRQFEQQGKPQDDTAAIKIDTVSS